MLSCQPGTTQQAPPTEVTSPSPPNAEPVSVLPRTVFETRSDYSHMKVVDAAGTRTLFFVHDDGTDYVQSRIRLKEPHKLDVAYTSVMMSSFLFRPDQRRCLIVGLGGGSMVLFLNHYFPNVQVDVVEIDPAIVKVARDYFGVMSSERTRIITADGAEYLKNRAETYDVIYLDAFLKVGPETDTSGAPRNLREEDFLKEIQWRLVPHGLVVINLHQQPRLDSDLRALRAAFPNVYVYSVPGAGNIIAVASLDAMRKSPEELRKQGRELDKQGRYGFSFERMVGFERKDTAHLQAASPRTG